MLTTLAIGAIGSVALRARRRARRATMQLGNVIRELALDDLPSADGVGRPPSVAIVMPAYNEADGIADVLREIPRELEGLRVETIVVVDGATDATSAAARGVADIVLEHRVNRGQGDALRTGFAAAVARHAEVVVTMDSDGQHRPDELSQLVKPILVGDADYVQGSRFLGEYDDLGSARDRGIRLFTWLLNAVTRAGVTDCTNGYRAIRATSLARLRLEEARFSAAEIQIEAVRRGLRVEEVPVHIRRRSHGESKKPPRLGYPLGFLAVIIRVRLRRL